MRTFCSVKLGNPEKVRKLLDILEEGEDIPMVFIPGGRRISKNMLTSSAKQKIIRKSIKTLRNIRTTDKQIDYFIFK